MHTFIARREEHAFQKKESDARFRRAIAFVAILSLMEDRFP